MKRHRGAVVVVAAALLLAGCAGPEADGGGLTTLAKVDGWLADYAGVEAFGLLELAYDRENADRLWAENVPDDLPAREGDPTEPGRYGDLGGVDFDTHVVGMWTSMQSGSCPAWVAAVTTSAGLVTVHGDDLTPPSGECAADANPYRVIIAIPRADLPDLGDLPMDGKVASQPSVAVSVSLYPPHTSG